MGNGTLNVSTLSPVPGQPSLRLNAAPAASWGRLRSAVQNRFGWTPTLTDAYRDYATQERLFRQRYTTTYLAGRPSKVWNGVRWYLKNGYAAAATPGTSNHGLGTTVDVSGLGGYGSSKFQQFAAIAGAHGWNNVEGRSINEPWHWSYNGAVDTVGKNISTPDVAIPGVDTAKPNPILPLDLEDDMKVLSGPTGRALVGPHYYRILANDYEFNNAVKFFGPAISVTADEMASAREMVLSGTAGRDIANSVWSSTVQRAGQLVPVKQELADAKSLLLGQKPASVDIDEAALAKAISAQLGTLSDADIKRIAKEAADEQARRLAGNK